MALIGLATRFTNVTHTIQQYQAVKDKIVDYGLNIIRLGSGDELFGSSYTWHNGDAVQWFLDNTDCVVVVDRDHTINLTSLSSSQQNTIDAHLEGMAIRWASYGDRLWLEPVNEYGGSDFYTQMQRFLDVFRGKGYTNWLVFNKQSQPWSACNLNDVLNKIYIGYHYYFNSWSYENAVNDLNNGAALGKPIFGSEEGASWLEIADFNSENVGSLNRYLQYCADAGYSNVVWMNHELNNMTRYEELGLVFPQVEPPPPPCSSYLSQATCEGAGCYWWPDGSGCHDTPYSPPADKLVGPLGIWRFPVVNWLGSLFPDVKIKTSTILEDVNKRWKDWLNED